MSLRLFTAFALLTAATACNGADLSQPQDGGSAACEAHGVTFCDAGSMKNSTPVHR